MQTRLMFPIYEAHMFKALLDGDTRAGDSTVQACACNDNCNVDCENCDTGLVQGHGQQSLQAYGSITWC